MTRIKRGNVARKRRKKVFLITQGFRGSSSKLFRTANQYALKGLRFSTRDRYQRKKLFRKIWIVRLNAIVRQNGINYNKFISSLKESKILLNRKVLAQIALRDQDGFKQILKTSTALQPS
jgi:large subunit ribosomal protein L20